MRLFFRFIIVTLLFANPAERAFAQNVGSYFTLNDAFKEAYENNPTLMAAREELNETKELYPQARAGWLPSVSGETSIYATDIESSNFSGATGATTKDVLLSVDQPIWRGGRTFAETARARELIKAGEALLTQAEQDLFLRAAGAYMNVVRDIELAHLRAQNEDILSQELQAAQERMEIGDTTKTDVLQAETRLLQARSQSIQAQADLAISNAAFEEITGTTAPDQLVVPYVDLQLPQSIDEMVGVAEAQNPELLITQFEHEAAEHNAKAVFRELLPQISAFASFNRQYDPQPGIVDQSETETIGLRATLALYEGGATRSRKRQAIHAAKRRAFNIQEARLQIKQETISNWRSYLAAQAETATRQAEIQSAEAALEGVREESRMGQRTILDILEADEDVIDAKVALAQAKRDETVAKFALAASLGLLSAESLNLQSN